MSYSNRYLVFVLTLCMAVGAQSALAVMPSHPGSDPNFHILPNGLDLRTVKSRGSELRLERGEGGEYTSAVQSRYESLKRASKADPKHKVQWAIIDLETNRILDQSLSANKRVFGASNSKIFVAATLLDKQRGDLRSSQVQLMADMLVPSDNDAWRELQRQAGDGNDDRGRAANYNFTQRMGYSLTRGYQGSWGSVQGNQLTAVETARFLYDTYMARYPGAETVWKFMHTSTTGKTRAKKYFPREIYVGGKTGTYSGGTRDPVTGDPIEVDVSHHSIVFNVNGREYGIVVLANNGSDDSSAVMVAGLLREYTGYRDRK